MRVFVLGAGFSADAGFPVARDFFAQWMTWMRDSGDKELEALRWRLRMVAHLLVSPRRGWAWLRREDWHRDVDIEQLLTVVESTAGMWDVLFDARRELMRSMRYTTRHYLEYTRRLTGLYLFWLASTERVRASYVDRFCASLRPGDVVVTFNWDTLLEASAARSIIRLRYGFDPDSTDSVNLLKLHGSVDWVETGSVPASCRALVRRVSHTLRRITDVSRYMDAAASTYAPFLVVPSGYKRYTSPILRIWQDANFALSRASQVIVVGYSMPATDVASATLLRLHFSPEAWRPEDATFGEARDLTVIDVSAETAARYRRLVSRRVRWISARVSEVDWRSL